MADRIPFQVRVLVKEPKGRDVGDEDVFAFFHDFSDKQYRIKINSIQMKETEEENKKTNDEVTRKSDRRLDLLSSMRSVKTLFVIMFI